MKKVFYIVLTLITLSGCGVMKANKNEQSMLQIKTGFTQDMVLKIMGSPIKTQGSKDTEYWLYKTDTSMNQYDNFTPIVFVNGRVDGWGRQYLKDMGIFPEAPRAASTVIDASPNNFQSKIPFPTIPFPPAPIGGNTSPFLGPAPTETQVQSPRINCNPNGVGGFSCR